MFLCPSTVLTWMMSLVLWYSIVALKCRNVCRWIALSLGLLSFTAVLLRRASKVVRSPCLSVWNILVFVLGRRLSISISLLLIGRIRLLLPFSAVM